MKFIRLKKYVHLLTVAATGRGKSIYVLIPNLLTFRGSVVCVDPKGELYQCTADHRRKVLGQRVFLLDPYGICQGAVSHGFNPLAFVDVQAPDFLDQLGDMANMLVMRTGRETEEHFNDAAEMVIQALLAYICACEDRPSDRSFQTFRDIVASPERLAKALLEMQQIDEHAGRLSRKGHALTWFRERELGSVLTTVQRHTDFLDSPPVGDCLDPRVLRSGNATVYLCLPHDKLTKQAPLMRLWIGSIIRIITRKGIHDTTPVTFFLDEAAALGKLKILEDAVAMMRGMGIRLWFFFQSLQQLKTCYGDRAGVILENCDTQQYFGVNSYESAEEVSKRCGDQTILVESYNTSSGRSRNVGGHSPGRQEGSVSSGQGNSWSEMARRLFKAEEILGLPDDVALVFHRNVPVVISRLVAYFDPRFNTREAVKKPYVGISSLLTAMLMLAASFLFAGVTLVLTGATTLPARPMTAPGYPSSPQFQFTPDMMIDPDGPGFRQFSEPGGVRHRYPRPRLPRAEDRLPSKSGFLIEIK